MASSALAVLCLMGPTASGKSHAALSLAQHLPVEIISVDSALVYRGMDIGTAKPSLEERRRVPHHLIDVLDPALAYSAAQFRDDALRIIGEVHARARVPLLVGGTMLYFKALRDGLDALPHADAAVRARLDQDAAQRGWPALHAELARVDAATAARLDPNDAQRIQRALEVFQLSGAPLSTLHSRRSPAAAAAPYRFVNIALEPSDRSWLHRRIAARLDAMFERGFIDEVRTLHARADLSPGLPSMRCVGYRQVWQYLEGSIDEKEMRARALAATRQLAKRQFTWLRSLPERHIVDSLAADSALQVQNAALRALHGPTDPLVPKPDQHWS